MTISMEGARKIENINSLKWQGGRKGWNAGAVVKNKKNKIVNLPTISVFCFYHLICFIKLISFQILRSTYKYSISWSCKLNLCQLQLKHIHFLIQNAGADWTSTRFKLIKLFLTLYIEKCTCKQNIEKKWKIEMFKRANANG